MRRQALVPLGRVLAGRGVRGAALLDLACGTGRFLREVKSNYPKLAVSALDLSPHYLELAREALAPWSGTTFLEAPAEPVPPPPPSFPVLPSIFLSPALPPKTR